MIILRILGRTFIFLALALLALALGIWLSGSDITKPGGQLWYETHVLSLQYTQVILERHLGLTTVWTDWVQNGLLQLPAWDGLMRLFVILLLIGGVLVFLGRDRRGKPTFRN